MLDFEHIALLRRLAKADRADAEEHREAERHDAAAACTTRAQAYEDRAERAEVRAAVEAHR